MAIQPNRDNNLRLTGDRDYLVTNSVNVADLTGFELNRTWLWKPLHHGGRLQPFVGFRYVKFIDFYQRQTYARYDDAASETPPNGIPPVDALTATTEQLTSLEAGVTNDMVGGQLGMHWDKDYRRWNFSGDVKAFALQNFQNWNNLLDTETTIYGGDASPGGRDARHGGDDENGGSATTRAEFVFGMEVRAEPPIGHTRFVAALRIRIPGLRQGYRTRHRHA